MKIETIAYIMLGAAGVALQALGIAFDTKIIWGIGATFSSCFVLIAIKKMCS